MFNNDGYKMYVVFNEFGVIDEINIASISPPKTQIGLNITPPIVFIDINGVIYNPIWDFSRLCWSYRKEHQKLTYNTILV